MTYQVIWEDAALSELDRIWQDSADEEGIQHVATRINTELAHHPTEAGESRDENYRILFKYPFIVWFQVLERIQEVHVLHVRIIKR